ncbi:glycosyltransferase family 4 protein [Phormidium sp. CCY1219]|uniref:glycosyltransferase family 4 protein n=1 Tax=Phormidium sp. CCY1219 TaxID=2886104 RepID=UPI002D1F3348|nr:glycosyltransferase family 4 protein [Phormidium sp. CCY1219]MEB3830094.1 glycosyltransferase family 4 protein [Phormidium sp. CCY1219]
MPTEKAHGYQICKMCEAFGQQGLDVLLLHPDRHQPNSSLQTTSVFDYYGITSTFKIQTLPNWDVVRLIKFIPDRAFALFFFTHAFLWAFYAAWVAGREKADLYYTRDISLAFWLVRLGLPTIYEAHVVPKRGQRALLRQLTQNSVLQLVVVLTSFIKKEFVAMGFPAEKVIVHPDAVDLSLFADLPDKQECRKRVGLPLERPIIGYIGRFRTMEMEKGIPELVEAMAQLPLLDGQEPLLLCVGGPMEAVPSYLELAHRLGVPEHRLQFVDRVPNNQVPLWMRACDVVTIPWQWTEFSAYFTSPMKLFEYMAAGVPIVASNLPSIREVLQHKENAWLVKPGDALALANALKTILSDRSTGEKFVENARRQVREYTWIERTQKVLKFVQPSSSEHI